MKKRGIFGGTFDPIHNGHLNLALHMLETEGLDEIVVIPARFSPLKEHERPIAQEHRREMVRLAIEPLKNFSLLDIELEREGPSYTIDTVHALKKMFPHDSFRLIIGEDVLFGLERWKQVEALLQMAPPLVGARPSKVSQTDDSVKKYLLKGLVPIPMMEISSTTIRNRLRSGQFCGHLLPGKVVDYIYENHLYY